MKISENWLRKWVNPAVDSQMLGHQLTMAGLELDGMEKVAPDFSGVVTGVVVTCEQHPDADKLKVTEVDVGQDDLLQIVCGAPNVRTGLKVAVATVGAVLPPIDGKPFKIKKGKLRGVESQGMLCGASELGLVDEIDGLLELPDDAPIGVDVREYLGLDTMVLDVAITPNRGDCLSALGLARELAVVNRLPLNRPKICQADCVLNQAQAVQVDATTACPRYLAQLICDIDRNVATPKWIADSLIASGVRTHNFLVDVTNFVLLELGQPLHAFDANKVAGRIVVRLAKAGETLELLNEQTITLTGDELVIADDIGAIALAGIMGGRRTAVSDETTAIVLESAFFNPLAIAGRARRFGMHTDASQRFERGVDFNLASVALDRATALIVDIAGGRAGQITVCEHIDELPVRETITLPIGKIKELIGIDIPSDDVLDILNRLEIETTFDGEHFIATPPSHRFDIAIPEDLIEEIARIYGYDAIDAVLPNFAVDMGYDDTADLTHMLKTTLADSGYFEAVSFSFSDAKIESLFNDDKLGKVLPLANPISSDLAVMRRTLLSSLLPVVKYNLNRQQNRVRLFETGLSFVGEDIKTLVQTPSLAIVAVGDVSEDGPYPSQAMDFYHLKGDIGRLLPTNLSKSDVAFERANLSFLHPGQSAYLTICGKKLGWFGQLHPSVAKALDLPTVWVAQFDLESLLQLHRATSPITAPSKFPSVRRDLAFLVDDGVTWQDLAVDVYTAAGRYLSDVWLFDVYQGDKLPAGKKSLAFAMLFQNAQETLSDDTIKQAMDDVIEVLSTKHNAQLRDS
ncbi:phenylalanine--tRNA ligase subunit beta [Moraxella nasovis]|uniref:phenylalanine--tRNA ligase subunit beta n=1 Tax=Moraxella nasovis TaxID=2904121 RepID=UPI001F603A16|nr:phenylalanine--tRNA ligase subunit beta [Moraxella nasovis]UNU72628.1 phenylalanine--tRNA ligase subunit beta [Moraxella nasovis]